MPPRGARASTLQHASPSKELKRPAVFSQLEQYAAAHPPATAGTNRITPRIIRSSISEGNAVAVTTTINDWFGSRVTADGLGFLLNDEMDDFSVEARRPEFRWPDSRRGQRDRPGQASTLFDDSDHRRPQRQNRDGPGLARQLQDHHHGCQCLDGCGGLRHEHPGGGERSAISQPMAARRGQCREMVLARYTIILPSKTWDTRCKIGLRDGDDARHTGAMPNASRSTKRPASARRHRWS